MRFSPAGNARRSRLLPDAPAPSADMTPMVDIVFLLLVFFLVGARFVALERRFDAALPKERGAPPAESFTPMTEVFVELSW